MVILYSFYFIIFKEALNDLMLSWKAVKKDKTIEENKDNEDNEALIN